jgi:hypothetical protein
MVGFRTSCRMRRFITCKLFASITVIMTCRRKISVGHIAPWRARNAFSNFVGKPEGKRQVVRLRRLWEDSLKMSDIIIR